MISDMAENAAARLTVEGVDAEIMGIPATIVSPSKAGWKVSGSGTLVVSLSNLTSLSPVTITAADEPSTGAPSQTVTLAATASMPVIQPTVGRP